MTMRSPLFAGVPGLLLALLLIAVPAQTREQEAITVLPFEGWQGRGGGGYKEALTDKILTRIIASHRFRVVDRAHLQVLLKEQKLSLTGLVDDATIVRAGRLIGVSKILTGSFTRNSTEYHPAEKNSQGKVTRAAYHSAVLQASVNLLDVETGTLEEGAEATGMGTGQTPDLAIQNALDTLARNVLTAFERHFVIRAFVSSVDNAVVTLDRGSQLGIKPGMYFHVHSVTEAEIGRSGGRIVGDKVGTLRVVDAGSRSAKARLMTGFGQVRPGMLLQEAKEEIAVEGSVLEKSFNRVTVNVGTDMGLEPGDVFEVRRMDRELLDPYTGQRHVKHKTVGIIYVEDVGPTFASGRILRGIYSIGEGMTIRERGSIVAILGVSASAGYSNATAEASRTVGSFTYDNKYTGEHDLTVNYGTDEDFSSGTFAEVSISTRELVTRVSVAGDLSFYRLSEDLGGWTAAIRASYHLSIIPEYLYLTPGAGAGFGRMGQDIPGDVVQTISNGTSDSTSDWSLLLLGHCSARLVLRHLVLFGDVSYRRISFDGWSFDVKTGKKDKNGNDEVESFELPEELVPYPKVTFGPLFVSAGVQIEF